MQLRLLKHRLLNISVLFLLPAFAPHAFAEGPKRTPSQLAAPTPVSAPNVGESAPDFEIPTMSGRPFRLSLLKGNPVVFEWVNFTCPEVENRYKAGAMQRIQKFYTERGVQWYLINSAVPKQQEYLTAEAAKQRLSERGSEPTDLLFDVGGVTARQFGVDTAPAAVLIDEKGVIRYRGAVDSAPAGEARALEKAKPYLVEAIKAVLGGAKVEPPDSPAAGCPIRTR